MWQFIRDTFHKPTSWNNRLFSTIITLLLAVNIVGIILQTAALSAGWHHDLYRLNFGITVFFAVEYLLRIITSRQHFLLREIFGPTALIDFVAIWPALVSYLFGFNLMHLTILRLLRIFRLFRNVHAVDLFMRVLRRTYDEMLIALSLMVIIIIFDSALMYYAEHAAQPHMFSSIPMTMWWAISTLTSVGNANMFPVTELGKVIASVTSLLSIVFYAAPAGILAAGFVDVIKEDQDVASRKRRRRVPVKRCPHCGESVGA